MLCGQKVLTLAKICSIMITNTIKLINLDYLDIKMKKGLAMLSLDKYYILNI